MTREIALHCMKSYSELHSDLCELCPIYGQTGSDHCFEDALQYVIGMLEQEPTTKNDLAVDAISRIETIGYLCKHCPDDGECFEDCDEIKHLRQMSSVTPTRPTGHWIARWDKVLLCEDKNCSICGYLAQAKYKFCPNCGALMQGVEG